MNYWKTLVLAAFAALALPAIGQDFPTKPVRVIISFTPGSSTDIVGRIVIQRLSEMWGQPVIPENRAGAGGSIGSAVVAKADPDGYTLLINSNAHCVNPAIYAKLPYDTTKDFTDIAPLAVQPNVLTVRPDGPYRTVMDLVNAAKAKPGAINIGHAGIGSGTHLTTEKFIAATHIQVVQIPFKGTPEVITAMFSGNVDAYWAPISAAMGSIRGGKLRPLAVSTPKRNNQLPDVPTPAEAGLKNAESEIWFGIFAPAKTPKAVVDKLAAALSKGLDEPAVQKKLTDLGAQIAEPDQRGPKPLAALVHSEIARLTPILKAAAQK